VLAALGLLPAARTLLEDQEEAVATMVTSHIGEGGDCDYRSFTT
jgi:hypothetical protein